MRANGLNKINQGTHTQLLLLAVKCLIALLFLKSIFSILYEYQWYFPVNFKKSSFLVDRETGFFGAYRIAFFAHIISGPPSLLLSVWLLFTGGRKERHTGHRLAGRAQFLIVSILAISGAVMSRQTTAGPIAGYGLLCLAILTLWTLTTATWLAIKRKFVAHRIWATRCLVLLCSPLLLRIAGGFAATLPIIEDTLAFYRWNAWLSWLVPLAIYEVYLRARQRTGTKLRTRKPPTRSQPRSQPNTPSKPLWTIEQTAK